MYREETSDESSFPQARHSLANWLKGQGGGWWAIMQAFSTSVLTHSCSYSLSRAPTPKPHSLGEQPASLPTCPGSLGPGTVLMRTVDLGALLTPVTMGTSGNVMTGER